MADKTVRLFKAKVSLMQDHWPVWKATAGVGLMALWSLSRGIGYRLLGRVTRRTAHTNLSQAWQEVWRRRNEWMVGYPRTAAPAHVGTT